MVRPRDDVSLMAGYHSPQVEVKVRLNTNEAPEPPPAAFTERLADELRTVEWHRYPDRAATELRAAIAELHGVAPSQVFAANGSNEVLQTLCLTYGGAGRSAAVFEPTYALHSHISRITGTQVVEGGTPVEAGCIHGGAVEHRSPDAAPSAHRRRPHPWRVGQAAAIRPCHSRLLHS